MGFKSIKIIKSDFAVLPKVKMTLFLQAHQNTIKSCTKLEFGKVSLINEENTNLEIANLNFKGYTTMLLVESNKLLY